MDFLKALEKNTVLKTEYGAGPSFAFGLFKKRTLSRKRKWLDGRESEDTIHEYDWKLGPFEVVYRSNQPGLSASEEHLLKFVLFKIFVFSNAKEFAVALKGGPSIDALKLALGLTPAGPLAKILGGAVDLDLSARAGFRVNVTRLIRDLKDESDESGLLEDEQEDEIDLD